jgi:hypothetical protein
LRQKVKGKFLLERRPAEASRRLFRVGVLYAEWDVAIITNLTGQAMRTLVQGVYQRGGYSVVWDGLDAAGQEVASGVYLYRLEVGGRRIVETKRMALVR